MFTRKPRTIDVWMCDPNDNITCYETEVLHTILQWLFSYSVQQKKYTDYLVILDNNIYNVSTHIRTTDGARHHGVHHAHGVNVECVPGAHTAVKSR